MKKINHLSAIIAMALLMSFTACNSGEGTTDTSDTTQQIPGINDSVPGVIDPGHGDTGAGVVEPPTTNDNNAIMPDSTIVNQ